MNEKLKTHPLVELLSERPDQPPKAFPLVGYIGPSHRIGYRRVHHDLQLSTYTEVPDDAIESVAPLDENNAQSPSLVMVKRGTEVSSHLTAQHPVEAGFLDGGIARGHLGSTVGGFVSLTSTPACVAPWPFASTLICETWK